MDDVNKQALMSAVRSLLIVLGSALAAHGLVTETQWTEIVGAITTIAPIVWGVWDKYQAEQKTRAREAVAVSAGIATATGAHSPLITPPDAAKIIATIAEKETTT